MEKNSKSANRKAPPKITLRDFEGTKAYKKGGQGGSRKDQCEAQGLRRKSMATATPASMFDGQI